MTTQRAETPLYPTLRTLPKDLGVALIVLLALAFGWLLFTQTDGQTRTFQEQDAPFRISYPASWDNAALEGDELLRVEDRLTDSIFKTTLTVERRDLDPASPPPVQILLDRRVADHSTLVGYHLLGSEQARAGDKDAQQLEYAYVAQPLDGPRRASLPVVVRVREYMVALPDRVYYITLAAPEQEFDAASSRLDEIIQTVQIS
jgi:hypothetical protein